MVYKWNGSGERGGMQDAGDLAGAIDWSSRLLYRDEDLAVVAKPSGIFTHRSALGRDRENVLRRVRDLLGTWVYPLHRLDRPTSGVLMFALSPPAAALFSPLLARREMRKRYWAVVRGWPEPGSGRVDRPLRSLDDGAWQDAASRYRVLAQARWPVPLGRYPEGRFALVEVWPETGRRHQIRRHLRGLDHPVIHDAVHGDTRVNRYAREQFGVSRLLLHALEVSFRDPRDGAERCFTAPLEPDMAALARRFSWPAGSDAPRPASSPPV